MGVHQASWLSKLKDDNIDCDWSKPMNIYSTTKLTKKIGESMKTLLDNGPNVQMSTTQKQLIAAFKFGTILVFHQNIKC